MSTRAVYAHARVSACARQLQHDHAVVLAGGRGPGGESDDEDGAALPHRDGPQCRSAAAP